MINLQTLKYKGLKNGKNLLIAGSRIWRKDFLNEMEFIVPAHFEYSEDAKFLQFNTFQIVR
jgi:hypothetical protein